MGSVSDPVNEGIYTPTIALPTARPKRRSTDSTVLHFSQMLYARALLTRWISPVIPLLQALEIIFTASDLYCTANLKVFL